MLSVLPDYVLGSLQLGIPFRDCHPGTVRLVTAVDLHESGLEVSAYRFDFRLPGRLLPGAAAPKRSATGCADDGPDKDNADRVPLRSLLQLQHRQSAKIRQQRLGD